MTSFLKGQYVWIPDPDEIIIPAQVVSPFSAGSGGKVKRLDNDKTVNLKGGETKDLTVMNEQSLEGVDDMVDFKELDVNTILHNLRSRYNDDNIYTNIGRILTAVNPFKRLSIYNPDVMDEYITGGRKMAPHIYGVGFDAFASMSDLRKNQSCIVSGESGSGKTETTKFFLQFVSEKSKRISNSDAGFEYQQKILESNPLMEAFGNAKTVRNDNSSRFGKYIQVYFDNATKSIVGGKIDSYLLEKSRLVSQAEGERNYHIFYQFCASSIVNEELRKYQLSDATQYYYLNQSDVAAVEVEGMDDKSGFNETIQAMERVNILDAEQGQVLNILAMILNLGNIQFAGGETSTVNADSKQVLELCATQLGCTPDALTRALVKIDRSTPNDPDLVGNNSVSAACDARDSFAKHIYAMMFDWLIAKINVSLKGVTKNTTSIGVLDIFGFEFFEVNSFEQLCINYTNERLQGHFNDHIFKLEQAEYAKEGIDVSKITFEDNENVITAIDGKGGVLQICGDAIKQKNSTDETILSNIHKFSDANSSDPRNALAKPTVQEIKKNKDNERVFIVKHYAGEVGYTIDGFLEKNRDTVPTLFSKLCLKSTNPFIKDLFTKAASRDTKALGLKFKSQLAELMSTLEETVPHYVRCVKPNADKVRELFDANMVKEQLEYAGLLEVCRIRKLGYPVRRTFKEFLQRYRALDKNNASSHTALIDALVKGKKMTAEGFQVGKAKVFLKDAQSASLEEELDVVLTAKILRIQAVARKMLARVRYGKWKSARTALKDAIKKKKKASLEAALFGFGVLPNGGRHLPEYREATELMDKIKDEEAIAQLVNKAIESRDLSILNAALHAAKEKNVAGIPEIKAANDLIGLINKENACKEELRGAIESEDEKKLKDAVAKALKLKIEDSDEFKEAEVLVKSIEDARNLRKNLESAINAKDISNIRKYMNEMANIGQQSDPLVAKGEALVKEKAKELAEISRKKKGIVEDLEIALKARNLAEIITLESQCIQYGIKGDIVTQAHKMRSELEGEKSLISKLSAETGAAAAKGLTRQGLTMEDVKDVEALVKEAQKILDKDDDHLVQALEQLSDMKKQLGVQDELAAALKQYKELSEQKKKQSDKGKRKALTTEQLDLLKEANEKAMELGLDTSNAVEIRAKINQIQLDIDERNREEMAKKREEAAAKLKDANEEEQQLEAFKRLQQKTSTKHAELIREASDTQRYHISKYYRIRALEDFVGNVASESKAEMAQAMLLSRPKQLIRSLTVLDDEQNQTACRINRAILQYCGDLSTTFPATLAQYILVRGLQDPGITDEIYLQLCKHIQGNKKPDSLDKAWLLMCMATKTFPPTDDFSPFLLNFLITHKQAPGMVGNYSRLCVIQLDATIDLGPTWFKPNLEEIQSYRQRPPILATIHNLDGTSQDYPVTPEMRVSQVLDMVRKNMEINDDIEHPVWGLYVSAEEQVEVISYKERLIRFYKAYNPSKLAHLDLFLNHWKDNEEELFEKLTLKYGPEPQEEDNQKKKGVLNLPITAAFEAVKMLGFTSQKSAPPSPEVPWTVPWWVHLGDVYYRMTKQKRVPWFIFKRRLIQKKMPTDKWLYLQCVDDVRMGYLPVVDPMKIAEMAAMAMKWKYSDNLPQTERELVHRNLENYIPRAEMEAKSIDDWAEMTMAQFSKVPTAKAEIEAKYVEICKAFPTYGMNFFYARHAASDKNYVIAVDINGVHVVTQNRQKVNRSFEFEKIQKFGATSEYFWMTIDTQKEKKKGLFLSKNHGGINVLLYTIQSWEMYDCVYDATHAPLLT